MSDICTHDGQPCFVREAINDGHFRCGTSACSSLFLRGYFTDRILAGDRLDPATGKLINIHNKD